MSPDVCTHVVAHDCTMERVTRLAALFAVASSLLPVLHRHTCFFFATCSAVFHFVAVWVFTFAQLDSVLHN